LGNPYFYLANLTVVKEKRAAAATHYNLELLHMIVE
jgi:hypothetical protein